MTLQYENRSGEAGNLEECSVHGIESRERSCDVGLEDYHGLFTVFARYSGCSV